MGKIVVGVDGSATSLQALRWAAENAALRDDEVVAVHVWHVPVASPFVEGVAPATYDIDFEREAKDQLEAALQQALPEPTSVKVTPIVAQGYAAKRLLELSAGADMLVIGSRGYGGFRGLLLGSVGHQCAQHATCPVVIIPHDDQDDEGRNVVDQRTTETT